MASMFVVRRRGSRNIERIQYEMEDVFQSLMGAGRPIRVRVGAEGVPAWRPPVEVYETDRELVVSVELAGLTEEQIEVIVDESFVTIRGDRQPARCEERRTVHAMGIMYGAFAAEVFLPFSVDHEAIEATYAAGMLTIRLPREAATRVQISPTASIDTASS
jgi:HSP20 family molecular chaperone IbpA